MKGEEGDASPRDWSRWRTPWGKSSRGSNVIGLAPLLAASCLYLAGDIISWTRSMDP
jgi:hypothetical protein